MTAYDIEDLIQSGNVAEFKRFLSSSQYKNAQNIMTSLVKYQQRSLFDAFITSGYFNYDDLQQVFEKVCELNQVDLCAFMMMYVKRENELLQIGLTRAIESNSIAVVRFLLVTRAISVNLFHPKLLSAISNNKYDITEVLKVILIERGLDQTEFDSNDFFYYIITIRTAEKYHDDTILNLIQSKYQLDKYNKLHTITATTKTRPLSRSQIVNNLVKQYSSSSKILHGLTRQELIELASLFHVRNSNQLKDDYLCILIAHETSLILSRIQCNNNEEFIDWNDIPDYLRYSVWNENEQEWFCYAIFQLEGLARSKNDNATIVEDMVFDMDQFVGIVQSFYPETMIQASTTFRDDILYRSQWLRTVLRNQKMIKLIETLKTAQEGTEI
ncbi:MAG: hypothetical protein EOP45_11365 [Sphingobacteriaceae bacterium]|nr:MAG: hypothetical protein EOP45_11365 [Sphingobacteriaceae bacterium]